MYDYIYEDPGLRARRPERVPAGHRYITYPQLIMTS